jgi:hypothetical protein
MNCTRQGCPGRAVWRPMLAILQEAIDDGAFDE